MNKQRGVAVVEKAPIFYDKDENGTQCYDGENYGYISEEQKKEMKTLRTDFMLIQRDNDHDKKLSVQGSRSRLVRDNSPSKKKWTTKSLKELREEFVRDADEMKKATKGMINMYKTGRDTKTAIQLAYHFLNKKGIDAELISYEESVWLEEASAGAVVFAEPYEGDAWKYDLNSAYPWVYSSVNFLIPVKAGIFETITEKTFTARLGDKGSRYGIYRCKIDFPSDSPNNKKIFKLNTHNKYTGIEINQAWKLKLNIELISDGEPNFLSYPRSHCKTGSECFGEFVKMIYPLRENAIIKSRCKSLLRCLWGALSQHNEITWVCDPFNETIEIEEGKEIVRMEPFGDKYKVSVIPHNKPYETNWARMKPFLLAKARVRITDHIIPYADHIHRCHTDSMTSDIELPIKCSMKLGDMKLEKTGHVKIINVQKELWD